MNLLKWLGISIVAALVIAVVVFGFTIFQSLTKNEQALSENDLFVDQDLYQEFLSHINKTEELSGSIYITSLQRQADTTTAEDDQSSALPDTYSYDPATGVISSLIFLYPIWFLDRLDSSRSLFVTQPKDNETYNPTVFITDELSETHAIGFNEDDVPGEQQVINRRLPRFSPSGERYLYSAQTSEGVIDVVSAWQIYVGEARLGYTPAYYADGYAAVWATDNYLVYIKENGIFAKRFVADIDSVTEPEFRLIPMNYTSALRNDLSISADGRYLAVAYPVDPDLGDSYIEIYKLSFNGVQPRAELMLRFQYEDGKPVFRPAFSPEGRYLAMPAQRGVGDTSNRLLVYDLVTRDFVVDRDLSDLQMSYTRVTDWFKSENLVE